MLRKFLLPLVFLLPSPLFANEEPEVLITVSCGSLVGSGLITIRDNKEGETHTFELTCGDDDSKKPTEGDSNDTGI